MVSNHEGWTPDYVASMPYDQLLAWACSSSGELSDEEAMAKIRARREGRE